MKGYDAALNRTQRVTFRCLAQSLDHGQQIDVPAAHMDGNDAVVIGHMLRVSFKRLFRQQVHGQSIARERVQHQNIEFLQIAARCFLLQ